MKTSPCWYWPWSLPSIPCKPGFKHQFWLIVNCLSSIKVSISRSKFDFRVCVLILIRESVRGHGTERVDDGAALYESRVQKSHTSDMIERDFTWILSRYLSGSYQTEWIGGFISRTGLPNGTAISCKLIHVTSCQTSSSWLENSWSDQAWPYIDSTYVCYKTCCQGYHIYPIASQIEFALTRCWFSDDGEEERSQYLEQLSWDPYDSVVS